MGREPDLTHNDLAIWINQDEDGKLKLSVQYDGEYLGTVKDFDNLLGLKNNWYVYIIRGRGHGKKNKGKTFYYVGSTWNLKKRFKEHKQGLGSTWFKEYKVNPEQIVYFEKLSTESEAREREQEVKNWSRDRKMEESQKFIENNAEFLQNNFGEIIPSKPKSIR